MAGEQREGPAVSPLLRGLSSDEQRAVLSGAASRRLAKGQVLFLQDQPAEALYQVEAGRLKLTQVTTDGQTVTVRFTGPDELCAAMAVLDGRNYPFSAMAVAPTRVLLWPRTRLRALFRAFPRLERNVVEIVGAHARDMLDKFRELATEPVAQRLSRTLLRLARLGVRREGGVLIERIRQQDLAEMTATSLYTVNRTLSDWEARGVLRKDRARILIRSEDQLRRMADPPRPSTPGR
jgi:CRP-like cAMP-binding protein